MTRVANPLLNGTKRSMEPSRFHDLLLPLLLQENPDSFEKYARLHGFVFKKK